ncbi:MAG: hypothetical protein QXH03_02910 [Candidatus Bathyarchaeia archaeon]
MDDFEWASRQYWTPPESHFRLPSPSFEHNTLMIGKIIEWGIPFLLGLIFKKRVARFFVIAKKRFLNEIISLTLLYTRYYSPCSASDVNYKVYEDLRTKIPSLKLLNIFPEGMRISTPVFGNIRILLEKIPKKEELEEVREKSEVEVEKIKITITPETSVRLGVREINDKLNDFAHYAETIFSSVEKHCLKEECKILESYLLIETPRIGWFVEEKSFELEDSELDAYVQATPNKVALIVKASIHAGRAVQKYLLI